MWTAETEMGVGPKGSDGPLLSGHLFALGWYLGCATTHGENFAPTPPSSSNRNRFLRRPPRPRSGSAAHAPSSGHRPPPYAAERLSSVSRIAYTGIRVGSGAVSSTWPAGAAGCDPGCRGGRGGTEPESRMSEAQWSRWACVMR